MSWITDNKGQGPWELEEQPTKWGYINNPRWSSLPKAVEFSEAVGNPIDTTDTHKPCGHWHKNSTVIRTSPAPNINIGSGYYYQPSVDVYDGKIGMVSMRYEGYTDIDGIVAMTYKDEVWTCLGVVHHMYVVYSEPNTCRITEDYMAFYCSCYDYNGDYYTQRLYIFKEEENPVYVDVFKWDWVTKSPYYVDAEQIYNTMDCYGDRIACMALAFYKDGNAYDKMLIKVSNDGGLTFPTEWAFPARTATAAGYWDRAMVRVSEDGIVWVCYVRAMGTTTMVELWKSNSAATSWTKIWEKDYSADLNGLKCVNFSFGITETDGKYITIQLYGGYIGVVGSRTYYHVIYTSSDYGVSFSTNQDWIVETYAYSSFATANGQYIVKLARKLYDGSYDYIFYRSTDYGVNFSELVASITYKGSTNYHTSSINQSYIKSNAITNSRYGVMTSGVGGSRIFVAAPDPPLTGYYPDMQKYHNEIAYVECGESFSPPAPSEDYQSVLYSDDNGATWRVIQSQIQNTDLEEDTILSGTVIITTELTEPQVWPM